MAKQRKQIATATAIAWIQPRVPLLDTPSHYVSSCPCAGFRKTTTTTAAASSPCVFAALTRQYLAVKVWHCTLHSVWAILSQRCRTNNVTQTDTRRTRVAQGEHPLFIHMIPKHNERVFARIEHLHYMQ